MRLKVFGIGLSKTGTSSLALALEHLGYRTVHNPTDNDTMLALLSGDFQCRALIENDAVCDIMFSRQFRELDRMYPESAFILTEREGEQWHASCAHHWASRQVSSTALWNEELVDLQVYGTVLYRRALFQDVYDSHKREVVQYFEGRPGKLLRVNICAGEGWEPLCKYLGVQIPRVPFPHLRPEPWVPPSTLRLEGAI
jgi:hypothetical protein